MGALLSLPPPVAIYLAVRAGRTDEVKAIVSAAYNGIPSPGCLEWQDEVGDTALSIAARNGDTALVNLLLNLGSNCSHLSEQIGGATALHEAVQNVRIRPRLVDTLLRNGANPFLDNDYGVSPWDIALARKQSTLCRRFEQERNLFANHLQLEVNEEPKEHRRRWVTIIPKYSSAHLRKQYQRQHQQLSRQEEEGISQHHPQTRYLYVFPNEQSSKYRQRINLATIKPPVVVRTQDGWKLFLGPIKKISEPSIEGSNLVFVFGSDKSHRKLLENFLTAIDPTRMLSLNPPPPKGKPIIPFKGLKPTPKIKNREQISQSAAFTSFIKNRTLPPSKRTISSSKLRSRPHHEVSQQVNGPCVICLENPQTAGFAHGQSIHRCVCKRCALLFTKQKKQTTCPICRQEIQHIITDFF